MITGRKVFRLWPANATEGFYPAPELKSGVKQSWIDAWNKVPSQAVDFHAQEPLEVVVNPGDLTLIHGPQLS